jgi:hypothetical protein
MSEKPTTQKEIFQQYSAPKSEKSLPAREDLGDGDVFLDASDEFVDLKLEDFSWKIKARKTYGKVLMAILIIQNLVVFGLVTGALLLNKMADLQLVFGVLVTATLGETAFMVKVIIEWLFKDINYPEEMV